MLRKIGILYLLITLLLSPAVVLATFIPNDSLFFNQNYLKSVRAQDAWELSSGDGVIIAILDSGVDINHQDLRDNVWINMNEIPLDGIDNDNNGYIDDVRGWDFVDYDNNPSPNLYKDCLSEETCSEIGLNHGTIVAGIAAAVGNNNEGIIGLAYNAKIMPLKVLGDDGVGNIRSVIDGINYAIKNKADIINLSLVGDNQNSLLKRSLQKAHDNGIVIVAASGNDISSAHGLNLNTTPMYPVCEGIGENSIIGVGAIDAFGKKSSFSNYGSGCIDISTIGENFYSTLLHSPLSDLFADYYGGWWNGTSVSTALVSGTAALIKSLDEHITNSEIEDIIINNTKPLNNLEKAYEGQMGGGQLDSYLAVKYLYDKIESEPKDPVISLKYLIASPEHNFSPVIKSYNLFDDNAFIREDLVYNSNFKGGVNITTGDVNGDGEQEIIVGAGKGGGPQIRVFDTLGRVKSQFFAFNKNLRGGVNVGSGDLTGDEVDEIVAGSGVGSEPLVKVFDINGDLIFQFLAYGKNFQGGVKISVGDIDGDGISEIITGTGVGGGPHIRVFDRFGRLQSQFFAYDTKLRGGVNVAIGDVDDDGINDIVTGSGYGSEPQVKIFNASGIIKKSFFVYNKSSLSSVNLAVSDIDNNEIDEIIVSPGAGNGSEIKTFNFDGQLLNSFNIFNKDFQEGVNIAIIKVD